MSVSRAVLSSARSNWKTPKQVYQVLDAEFGFDCDPCPTKPKQDGLKSDWGNVCYCNPPYDRLYDWVAKGFAEWKKGKTIVFLIPARTDTRAWHEFILKASEIRFIKGRLSFDDKGGRATFPSVIVVCRAQSQSANDKKE